MLATEEEICPNQCGKLAVNYERRVEVDFLNPIRRLFGWDLVMTVEDFRVTSCETCGYHNKKNWSILAFENGNC